MSKPETTGLRLLVCGGRDYANTSAIAFVLGHVHEMRGISTVIQGGASGADLLAAQWARSHGIQVETFNANWEVHGRAAGPIRNKQMIEEGKPNGVVAFPGGRGTADMIQQAEAAGFKVLEVREGVGNVSSDRSRTTEPTLSDLRRERDELVAAIKEDADWHG